MTISLKIDSHREPELVAALPPSGSAAAAHAITTILPARGWQLINVRELWKFRELLYFLAWRDVKIRYKQTVLGAAWAIIQPALMMVVFTIFFGRMAGVPSSDFPYPLFVYAGLLPWTFFATAITQAGNSVVGSERLITKIYFPRLAIPFAAVGATIVDFVVALGLLIGMMAYYGIAPGPGLLLVPLLFGLFMLAALGVGTLLAALNVSYRDFRYVIPFLVQIWLFATPSVYMDISKDAHPTAAAWNGHGAEQRVETASRSQAQNAPNPQQATGGRAKEPGVLRSLMALNPMIPLVASFRAAALGGPVPWGQLGVASVSSVLAFLIGCFYFRRVEDNFADIV